MTDSIPSRRIHRLLSQSLEPRHLFAITIEPLPPMTVDEGELVSLQAVFDDNSLEQHYSAEIDWGDHKVAEDPFVRLPKRATSQLVPRIDYRFDTFDFFDTAAKRSVVTAAATHVLSHFADELGAISSSSTNRFDAIVNHPATGQIQQLTDFSVGRNEIVIFVGGRDLGGTTLAFGGHGGFSANGTDEFREYVETRGQQQPAIIDFAPWGGHISFDIDTNWHVGISTDGLEIDETDLYSVAVHEMFHVLGFNHSVPAFSRHVAGSRFGGPHAIDEYDINTQPPLADDLSHWSDSVRESGMTPLVTPSIDTGTRKSVSSLDLAAMQDVGWELLNVSSGTVTANHSYDDDGLFTGFVRIQDSTDSETALLNLHVRNVRPELAPIADKHVRIGQVFEFESSFRDPGRNDTHSATIDWGDGFSSQLLVDEDDRFLSSNHIYDQPGIYTAIVRISDDDGGIGSTAFFVDVQNVVTPTSAWQNRLFPLDVSRDQSVAPIDALLIINEINRPEFADPLGRLPIDRRSDLPFFDVNGDGFVTSGDAIRIINDLNSRDRTIAARGNSDIAAAVDDFFRDHDDLFESHQTTAH